MRSALLVQVVALLTASVPLAAQAPDDNFVREQLPEPTFPKDAQLSLVTGRLVAQRPIGSFPCPEQHICVDAVWDDTFEGLETRLGPQIDPSAHIRSVHDAGLAGRPVVAYVVKRADDGQLWAIELRVVGKNRACFDGRLADEWLEFASHPRTMRKGDEACFMLN